MSAKYTHTETQFAAARQRAGAAGRSGYPSAEMLQRWKERRARIVREQIDAGIIKFYDGTGTEALRWVEEGA